MPSFLRKSLVALAFAITTGLAMADGSDMLKDGHPDRYTVVKGDTLWDISGRFLNSPWLWPEVWHVNPQIENPHLIYPGDIISLTYVDGKPRLSVQRGRRTVKLGPTTRVEQLDSAISAIPIEAIKQFLNKSRVLDDTELESSPYVVAIADEHVIGGAGHSVYVRAIEDANAKRQTVYRSGQVYRDPDSDEILGYEGIYVGDGSLKRAGDPATLYLERTAREVRIGDRVVPAGEDSIQHSYMPSAPASDIDGKIIAVLDGVSQIGQYQVVVLNKGAREGLVKGNVLRIERAGTVIRDIVSDKTNETVELPTELSGYLMIFNVFEKTSYGLVMEATRAIHKFDSVSNP